MLEISENVNKWKGFIDATWITMKLERKIELAALVRSVILKQAKAEKTTFALKICTSLAKWKIPLQRAISYEWDLFGHA